MFASVFRKCFKSILSSGCFFILFAINSQDKHEENHQPKLHGGLVIKHNANQRYATNAVTSLIFREIANKHNLPTQVRSFHNFSYSKNEGASSFTSLKVLSFSLESTSFHIVHKKSHLWVNLSERVRTKTYLLWICRSLKFWIYWSLNYKSFLNG